MTDQPTSVIIRISVLLGEPTMLLSGWDATTVLLGYYCAGCMGSRTSGIACAVLVEVMMSSG